MNRHIPPAFDTFEGLSHLEIERRARAMQARYVRESVGRFLNALWHRLRREGGRPAPHAG